MGEVDVGILEGFRMGFNDDIVGYKLGAKDGIEVDIWGAKVGTKGFGLGKLEGLKCGI